MKQKEVIIGSFVKVNGYGDLAFEGDKRPFIGQIVKVNKITRAGLIEVLLGNNRTSVPARNLDPVKTTTWFEVDVTQRIIKPLTVLRTEIVKEQYVQLFCEHGSYYLDIKDKNNWKFYPTWEEARTYLVTKIFMAIRLFEAQIKKWNVELDTLVRMTEPT